MSEPTQTENSGRAPEGPAIDMAAFRQDMREQDLEELVDELVEAFVEDAPARFDAVTTAIQSAEADSIRTTAHAYKSAAATTRAFRLADLLQQTEAAARDGDVGRAAELLPQLKTEHEAALAQLR
jgi:HPt (histidine-containing phosphotransfer) domain-containing protein